MEGERGSEGRVGTVVLRWMKRSYTSAGSLNTEGKGGNVEEKKILSLLEVSPERMAASTAAQPHPSQG
jgi:hypothetical protein